jgi:Zn-finger nucleic acid-binding protein
MDCANCGAPLPAKSNICEYCKTLNDTDLRGLKGSKRNGGASERSCPRCKAPMQQLRLGLETAVEIERCTKCYGIFFDPGELEEVLDASVKRAYEVDLERLDTMIREETSIRDYKSVTYVPCPDCGELMHRKSYGARAGVVVDRCKLHGVWLDGGELNQLLKWAKAGGRKHDREQAERRVAAEARAEKDRKVLRHTRIETMGDTRSSFSELDIGRESELPGLLHMIAKMIA